MSPSPPPPTSTRSTSVASSRVVANTQPTLPHTITSTKTRPLPEEPEDEGPKVVTIASAATHPDGGPIHATTKVTDDVPVDVDVGSAKTADMTTEVLDKAQEQIAAAKAATQEIWQLSGMTGAAPAFDIKLPKMEGDGSYKATSRPLNSEEKSGAWILGGVISAVLLLGGIGSSTKKKVEEKVEEVKTKQ